MQSESNQDRIARLAERFAQMADEQIEAEAANLSDEDREATAAFAAWSRRLAAQREGEE
jgi:hypothetical protein